MPLHLRCGYCDCGQRDAGGSVLLQDNWTTFVKARLNCSLPGQFPFYYNELQSTFLLRKQRLVYAVFTTAPSVSATEWSLVKMMMMMMIVVVVVAAAAAAATSATCTLSLHDSILVYHPCPPDSFLSRVSALTRVIDIAVLSVRLSVCLSVTFRY